MTLNELTYMLTIAEYGSLSKAAQELFVSQPSLSEALTKIERDMGQQIFHRTQGGLVPTDFGFRYLDTAARIKYRYRQMLTELEEYREMRRGSLTFGIPLNLGTCLLPQILPAFHAAYPGITVRFRENNSTELDKLLLTGKIDFSIMHYEAAHKSITYEHLADDPFYLVIPKKMAARYHFPASRCLNACDLKVLSDAPYLMVASRQKLRQVTDSILKQIGINPDIRYTTKSMETAKRLAAAGMGVTFLPCSYLTLFSGTEGLACYPLDPALNPSWQLVLAYPNNLPLSRCAREFIRHLKESGKNTFPISHPQPSDTPSLHRSEPALPESV